MNETTTSHFEHTKARRERVPLLLALYGPSGGGKTKSALRLADGIRRVSGGKVFMIDTEARRGLHYADEHDFEHVPFLEPFGSLRYLDAIEHCAGHGAGVIIVDSMSHEHEGPGGLLEFHAAEVERLSRGDDSRAERVKMLAWQRPKADRRRMINTILQMTVNFIFCFRAKEKLLLERGKDPKSKGFMPITGEEFVYEMTATALLMPCADGVPTWQSNEIGEQMMIKRPAQFRPVLDEYRKAPLCEEIGEAMARWAAGGAIGIEGFVRKLNGATTRTELDAIGEEIGRAFPKEDKAKAKERAKLGPAWKAAEQRVNGGNGKAPTEQPPPPTDPEDFDR